MTITFRVNDTNLRRKVNAAVKVIDDTRQSRHPLRRLDRDKKRRISEDWRNARVTGATVQGARWPALKGPPDPPWGGRTKKRGKGVTKGKLRTGHDGRKVRMTTSSRIGIVSWILFRAVINAPPDIRNNTLRIGLHAVRTVEGARRFFQMRPLRWTAQDQRAYRQFGREFLDWFARSWNSNTLASSGRDVA